MPQSIEIRPMEDRDIVAVADLSGELGYPTTSEQTETNFRRIRRVSALQPSEILVAESPHDRSVVGWVHVCVPADLVKSNVTEIWGLVVSSAHRGNGYGRALMKAAEAWALDHDCIEMQLRSSSHRTEAHAFYERLGYRIAKVQKVFTRPIGDQPVNH